MNFDSPTSLPRATADSDSPPTGLNQFGDRLAEEGVSTELNAFGDAPVQENPPRGRFDPFTDGSATALNEAPAFDPFGSGLAKETAPASSGGVAVEDLFQGADKISSALPREARDQLDAAAKDEADPNGFKMRAANTAFLADRYGKPVEEVSNKYELLRDHYAREHWHEPQPLDDAKFYGTVGIKLAREKLERVMLQEIQVGLFHAVDSGQTFNQAFEEQRALHGNTPGWHAFNQDYYRQLSKKQWDTFTESKTRLQGAIDPLTEYMTLAKRGTPPDGEGNLIVMRQRAIESLQGLPDNEAQMVMDFAASQAARGTKNDEPAGFVKKLGARMDRGLVDFGLAAVGSVEELGRKFMDPKAAASDRRQAQLERQLDQRIRGEVDPMKANGWIANEALNVAEGMPKFASVFSLPGIVANYAATKEELRGGYEDQGITAGKADLMAAAAAIPQTAINFVSSKMAVGLVPGGSRFLGKVTEAGFAPLAKQAGKYLVAESLVQTPLAELSQLSPTAVQSIASHFDQAIPDVPGGFLHQAGLVVKSTPETFAHMLPFILLGTGMGTFHDRAAGKEYVQNKTRLTALGLSDAAAARVMDAPTPEKAAALLQEHWDERKASEEQKTALASLDREVIQARQDHGETYTPEEAVIVEKHPETFATIPPGHRPIEIAKPDGTVEPAGFVGVGDKGETMVSRPTAEGWAVTELKPGETIVPQTTTTSEGANVRTPPAATEEKVIVTRTANDAYTVTTKDGAVLGTAATAEGAARVVDDHAALQRAQKRAPVAEGSDKTQAFTQEEIASLRERLALAELPPAERKTMEETLRKAKESGAANHAEALADEINANPRAITPEEHAAMLIRGVELHNAYDQLMRQAAEQMDQGNVHKSDELTRMAEGVLNALDRVTEATNRSGTEAGRALSMRRMRIDVNTYQLASLVQRARLAKRGAITPEQTEQLRVLSEQMKVQQGKIDAMEKELAEERKKADEKDAETFVSEGRQRRSKVSKDANIRRRVDLKKQLMDLGLRVNDITGVIGQGAEVAAIVAKLAKTYIEDGANTLHEVAGKLKADIPDLTEQDIFNSLGGHIHSERKRIVAEAHTRVVELKKQASLWADIYDKANGLDKLGKALPKGSEEIASLRELLAQLRLQAGRAIHDDKLLKSIHEKISAVQDQLTGGFRDLPEKAEELARNEKIDTARKELADLRKEMGLTDTASQLREQLRTGEAPPKEEPQAKPADRLDALREEVAQLRKEIADREKAPPPTADEINAGKLERLNAKLEKVSAQIEGGFRTLPEPKKAKPAETVDLAQLRTKVRELQSLMRNEDAIHDLEEQLRTGNFKVSAPEKRLIQNAELQNALIKRQQLQREVNQQIEALKPKTVGDRVVSVLTLPRSILATADMSATLRQGLFLSARRPITAAKTFAQAFKAFFSQNTADAIDLAIRRHPNQIERQRAGLFLSSLDHVPAGREEAFVSNLATKIPLFGHLVEASERNMVTTLNLLRTATFDQFLSDHPEATREQKQAFAAYVNAASGRGDLGDFGNASKTLASVFFAPRYAVSRFQLLYSPFRNIKDPVVRNEIVKDFAAFATTGVAVLGMAALAGAKVGKDPESPDFGKIVIGNTHIDIWGGLQQPVRLMLQPFIAGLDRAGLHHSEKQINLLDAGSRYMQFKLAPSVTIPVAALTGKNVIRQDQTISETVVQSIVPLVVQDAYSLFHENESKTFAAGATAASFLGMGVAQQSPPKDGQKRRARAARE